ncbi:MAG TPA: DNRLRE domain-containing protein [Planctomycetota bacterium]|nr:DNRLRE domain-containing protein [Planctomycetota bacterium]
MRRVHLAVLLSVLSLLASAAEQRNPAWPPKGTPLRVPVTRDTWVSSCSGETQGNNGGANTLKTKAYQEFFLVDIDPAPLKGRVIAGAVLHLHCSSKDIQKRLSVSSLASEWVEGTGTGYAKQPGSSCFEEAELGKRPWAYPGSDITAVMMGEGNTLWATWDSTPPDAKGWQTVAVEPRVIAARVAGLSHGFVVFDDTGSEWTRSGESVRRHIFPNRFVHSRNAGAKTAPYFTIYLGDEDKQPPAAPADIRREQATLPAGEAIVSWASPADALGFKVGVVHLGAVARDDGVKDIPVPRYLIPMAMPGQRVQMHLRDMGFEGSEALTVFVSAVDAAGNAGPAATTGVKLSATPTTVEIAGSPALGFTEAGPLPKLGATGIAVIDPLDKVNPASGALIPSHDAAYLAANHLWSAKDKRVRLYAAKNEFVAFQVVLKGAAAEVTPSIKLPEPLKASLLEFRNVKSKSGMLPDPLVPIKGSVTWQQAGAALLADLYVPHETPAGKHQGTLTLAAGGETLSIAIELNVWDFGLPDFLSFIPEMNSYGLPSPEAGYYRVGHAHRTCVNALPYSQGGSVRAAPKWDGAKLDWAAWDKRFGPLLDGSAFADLPRRAVPLDSLYLPLHENWPCDIFKAYNGSYWADRAFPPEYRETFVKVSRLFAEHFAAKGWNDTFLQFYLNNKSNFKERGWSRGASPWILDEPASFQDYWALRWFAAAFHEGAAAARGKAKVGYRIDISRPEWERDCLEPLNDFYVCSGVFRKYRRMILDRQRRNGMIIFEYGSSNPIEAPNVQPAGWCVSAWCLGADGVLPWQTIGNDGSWANADECSVFYPGSKVGSGEPIPSVRLKAYRRGQQDVEYLTLLTQLLGAPRWAVGQAVQDQLRLVATARKAADAGGIEDAGRITLDRLSPVALWELRTQVGGTLSKAKPAWKRRLVDLRTPARDVSKLATFLPEPRPPVAEKGFGAEAEQGDAIIIQGKPAVTDALIHFEEPTRAFGGEARSNALRRTERSNAFLAKFDLAGKLPQGTKVASARLTFCVWDPSSKGKTRVAAFRITSDWDERAVTWKQAAAGKTWADEAGFEVGKDTPKDPEGDVIVPPEEGADTANPPLEYSIDVTKSVKAWLAGDARNLGLAIVPIIDRSVDDGQYTRIQVLASEYNQKEFTPKLTIRLVK